MNLSPLYILLLLFAPLFSRASSIGTNKFEYFYITYFSLSASNDPEAKSYLDSLTIEAEQINNDYYYSKAYFAQFNEVGPNNDSSAVLLDKSVALIASYDDSAFFVEANSMSGRLGVFKDDFFKGVVGINKSLKAISTKFDNYYDQIGERIYIFQAKCLSTLGIVYQRLEDYELGLDHSQKALKLISVLDSDEAMRLRISLIANIGYAYCNLKNYDKAEYYIQRSLDLKGTFEGFVKAFEYRTMASVAYGRKKYDLALRYLKRSDDELAITDREQEYHMNTFWYGKIYLAKGQYSFAEKKFLSIVEPFEKDFTQNDIADLYELLGETYHCIGDLDKEVSYYKKALKIRAEYGNSVDRKGVDEFLSFYDQEQENTKDRIIEIRVNERKERTKIEIKSEQQKKNWIYSLFAIITVLLIIVIISITLANRINRRRNNELKDLVDQKNVLFKEVHHRVKNNFQIISSLLNLQQDTVNEQESTDALEEAQRRIRSMSLVHEMLYEQDNIKEINLKDYAVSLTSSIIESIRSKKRIAVEIIGDGFFIDLDKAIPLGLILNEAATNAAKHAFKGIDKPKITIFLNHKEGESIISIVDNGVGIPEGIRQKSEGTLGLELIHILAEQINGNVNITCDNGTSIKVSFK